MSDFTPSRLIIGTRTIQAYMSGEDFELRLLEGKTYITPRLLFTPFMHKALEANPARPVELGPLIIQRKHPHVLITLNGELWATVDVLEWGGLLGSQVMGEPWTRTHPKSVS